MFLTGKVAVLTGGSGGIGSLIARRLLSEGASLAIVDISRAAMNRAVQELCTFGKIKTYEFDISNLGDVLSLKKCVLKDMGTVDILINAAGVQGPIGAFRDNDLSEWIRNINVNLLGTVSCCHEFVPVLVKKKAGKIINFAGGGANSPRPNFSAYSSAKAAVVRFTETLAEELRNFNIQVNAVSPGVIRTQMIEETLKAGSQKAGPEYDQIKARTLSGFDDPETVSELVCYLASASSDWLTGKNISAIWDPWKKWISETPKGLDKDLYVLRRIDERNFRKA